MNGAFHLNNRQQLMEKIGSDSVAVFFAAPEATYSHDVHYPYRQDSNLHYLTGFPEPEAVAILAPGHEHPFTLFVRPRDLDKEIWNGFRAGVEGAKDIYGADAAYTIDELADYLPTYLADRKHLYFKFGASADLDAQVFKGLNAVRGQIRNGVKAPQHLHDPGLFLNEMRLFKQPYEIEMMRKAAVISAEAHMELMKALKPGVFEFQMESVITSYFRERNARMGYPAIVGGGVNGTILHYIENQAKLEDGMLLLVDAGAEYAHYNADITRTSPVNGRFNASQRAVYEVVLKANEEAIAMTKPGVGFDEINAKATQVITEGLVDLKLLQGNVSELIETKAYQKFYMHKTGHWLGGDVHDMGDYLDENGNFRKLQAGMVMTVEPGIYVGPHLSAEVPEAFHHIGIRIEDDILVTETGYENMTEAVPKSVDAIEALMAGN